MDVLASRVALKSGLKKEKSPKLSKKIGKVSKPAKSVKSPSKIIKKTNKKNNVSPQKIEGKTEKIPQIVTNKKKEVPSEIKNEIVTKTKGIKRKVKEDKKAESQETPQVLKKQKKFPEKQEKPVVKKQDSSDSTPQPQLSQAKIKKGVETVLKLAKLQAKSGITLMDGESTPIFLQVCCMRIPKTPTRQLRMLLPHSLVSPDDDVALIVKDLKKGRRTDFEPTVDHFQQLLQDHKCTQIKAIIPVNQIKTEYDQFELRRNLLNLYDHFLIDGRVSGHVARMLGKIFIKKRKLPHSIRMGSKDLKHEIDHALKKTSMQLNSNGDTNIVQIGTTSMKKSQIVENIDAVCKILAKQYPGGWPNIYSLRIKTPKDSAVPIYVTLKNKELVDIPVIEPKRPKAHRTVEGELTTLDSDAMVSVTPEGEVTVTVNKKESVEPKGEGKDDEELVESEEDEDDDEDEDEESEEE